MSRLRGWGMPSQVDYLIVLLLVNLSGNQALTTGGRREPLLLLALALVLPRMLKQRQFQNRTFVLMFVAYALLFAFQTLALEFFAVVTIAGFFTKLVVAAALVSTVRFFRLAYVRVIVWLTLLSFVFHVPNLMAGLVGVRLDVFFQPIAAIVGAEQNGVTEHTNILLHTFMYGEDWLRNAGIFWEPGAFSGYLILALVLLATIRQDVSPYLFRRWRAILILGLLSTLSTTGYLVLPFALFTFKLVALEKKRDMQRQVIWFMVFLAILIPVGSYAWNLDFIGPKIVELYSRAINQEVGWQLSRFGSVVFDWAYIQERPFLGWGQNNATQFALSPDFEDFRLGNGFTGYMRQLGLTGMAIYLLSFWAGLRRLGVGPATRMWILAIVVTNLNGEYFLDFVLYTALHFIGLEQRGLRRSVAKDSIPAYAPVFDRRGEQEVPPC